MGVMVRQEGQGNSQKQQDRLEEDWSVLYMTL